MSHLARLLGGPRPPLLWRTSPPAASQTLPRQIHSSQRLQKKSEPPKTEAVDSDAPVKFSTSDGFAPNPFTPRGTMSPPRPNFEFRSIQLSVIAFLVYFCILREENDIDERIREPGNLYDVLEGLERKKLEEQLKTRTDKGLDTKAIRMRLSELRKDELAGKDKQMPVLQQRV